MSGLEACADPSGLKLIVAPSAQMAVALKTAAARVGRSLVNVEAVSVAGLALHVWRAMQPWQAARLVSSWQLEVVLASALRTTSNPEGRLFSSSLSTLVQSIQADRLAGRDASWAAKRQRNPSQEVYAELFGAYEHYLNGTGRLDMADVHRVAVEQVEEFCEARHLEGLVVCRNVQLLPAQKDLLVGLSNGARVSILLGDQSAPGFNEPLQAGSVFTDWTVPKVSLDTGSNVRVIQAATRREEVWSVFSDILTRCESFDDVELAVSSNDLYRPHIEAACRRLSIPLTSSGNEDGTIHPVDIALRGFLSWVASGYKVEELQDLLRSGTVFNPIEVQQDTRASASRRDQLLDPLEIARLLSVFRLTPAALSNPDLRSILLEGAARDRVSREDVDRLLKWFMSIRERLPDSVTSPSTFVERIWSLLRLAGVKSLEGNKDRSNLEKALEPLLESDFLPVESTWLAGSILDQLSSHRRIIRDDGSGLHVTALSEAGYGPRSTCYVLGLDDQASSTSASERSTHPVGHESTIPSGYGDPTPARYLVAELKRRFGDRLICSVPAWDVADERILFPGSSLVEIAKMKEIRAEHRMDGIDMADRFCRDPWRVEAPAFPSVLRGLQAEAKRNESGWTEYDGMVASHYKNGSSDEEQLIELRMSPSRLEVMLSCPYRYFLSSVLKLRAGAENEEEWMDAASEGNVLHELFERHTRARIQKMAGFASSDEEQMLRDLRAAVERQALRSGDDVEAMVHARYLSLAHGVRTYFRRERQLADEREPVHAEFSFSDHESSDAPPARFRSDQGEITVTGRIDRIDELNDGSWVIIDFKTSKPDGFVPDKLLSMNEKIQWALYAWAASETTGKKVSLAEYVFTSRKGSGWVSQVAAPSREQVEPLLDSVLKRVASNHFMPAPDPNTTCQWCDFKAICGDLNARKHMIREKFRDSDPAETDAYEGWAFREKSITS